MSKLLDDCFLHDKQRLRHGEALAILKGRIRPVVATESVPLAEAEGRILAAAATAARPVPAHTNAAVDGYSFAAADYDRAMGSELVVEGRAAAGHPLARTPARRAAARIFTGAAMPEGHDTVVMQEDAPARTADGRTLVAIPAGLKPGANVRKAGEDVKAGETVLAAGAVLRPQDLAVVRAGEALAAGQVYDANAPMLAALVRSAGAEPTDLGVFPDSLEAVQRRLAQAARDFDVVVTSGGASRGEEDHMVAALDRLGKRHMWQLAIKPGRPMSFGQIGDTVVLGLPGNPVAVFVCFLLYVWPLLRRMGGAEWPEPRRYKLPALFAFQGRKTGRREFWRGMLKETPRGLAVDKFARDGSGLISGLRAADGLIDIPEEKGDVQPGDPVAFIPLTEFGIVGR
jgi:molybdopterin molybdotransferase